MMSVLMSVTCRPPERQVRVYVGPLRDWAGRINLDQLG